MEPGVRISVVTVAFNSAATLAATLDSVLAQTCPAHEHLIVDGGSDDGTLDILKAYAASYDGRLKWISEPDRGIYDAMNKGIALAEGELIGLLNSDDCYEPDALCRVLRTVRERSWPARLVVHGDLLKVSEKGEPLQLFRHGAQMSLDAAGRGMPINHPASFVSRAAYDEIGSFDLSFRYAADYDLVARAARAGVEFIHVAQVLTRMRVGGASDLARNQAAVATERFRIRRPLLPPWRNRLRYAKELVWMPTRQWLSRWLIKLGLGRVLRRYAEIKQRRRGATIGRDGG